MFVCKARAFDVGSVPFVAGGTHGAGGVATCVPPDNDASVLGAFEALDVELLVADCCNATSAACKIPAAFGAEFPPAFASEDDPRLSCFCPVAFALTVVVSALAT